MTFQCFVFIAVSLDGYIAREDGDISWLADVGYKITDEDYGFRKFFNSIDTLVVGRNTYQHVLGFPEWPYENKRVIVLSHSPLTIPVKLSDKVEVANMSPLELANYLESTGAEKVYVDGGKTIQGFLLAGLIQEMIITTIPVLLGGGKALFTQLDKDVRLELLDVNSYENGFVQTRYAVRSN